MALKVLMVGGRRCGKTSALAITFDQIINGPIKNYFTISDKTVYQTKGSEAQDVLNYKQLELQQKLERKSTNIFLVDSGPTYFDWKYTLGFNMPGSRRGFDVEFTDVPGEWFEPGAGSKPTADGGSVQDVMTRLVEESDVFMIMVDTPYIMHESAATAKATNSIDGIHNYLTNIGDTEKLVIFAPIKCEKWVKEGKMNEVVDRIKKLYSTLITALTAYPNMAIAVIPVETAGNILFFEHSDPTILAEQTPVKCKKLNNRFVRISNGETRILTPDSKINPDPTSISCGITRPYTWFQVNQDAEEPLYRPRNCEQLPVHSLRFYLRMLHKRYPGFIPELIWKLLFGKITRSEIEQKIADMQKAGLIKDNVDSIQYLKRPDWL